uniref:Uncharacterized protein n=1 Tax=Thermogemmatispora argillosa TaxID=2045280 RepID=A0A455T1R8_9CHLR|nr:hypothetical protein KTA_13710 [Thermogemmatispora argillosa]
MTDSLLSLQEGHQRRAAHAFAPGSRPVGAIYHSSAALQPIAGNGLLCASRRAQTQGYNSGLADRTSAKRGQAQREPMGKQEHAQDIYQPCPCSLPTPWALAFSLVT